jgi:tetratricopeptide (TPR) repeat protein
MLVLVVPIFYVLNAEAALVNGESEEAAASHFDDTGLNDAGSGFSKSIGEETPVIKLASLTVSTQKPSLEILEPAKPLHSDTRIRVERASDLAKAQKFDEALAELGSVYFADQDNYSVRFLEARILAWSGNHAQAEIEFEGLRSQYPQDLDILVSFGYLRFYQRDYSESEDIFTQVLAYNPDYGDARTGLERSRLAQNKAN